MKRITWRKHHKWFGLLFCFFMLMFCWSGIVLNHREAVADINVSRKWLPAGYRFEAWNGGLLRGTLHYTDKDSVLIYWPMVQPGYGARTLPPRLLRTSTKDFPKGRTTVA